MTQERNAKDGGRSCWKTARERERLRARFEIRDRVANGTAVVVEQHGAEIDVDTAARFLRHVADGSVSSFSLSKLAKHVSLLTRPLPSSMLSQYKIKTLCTSRFGETHAQHVLDFQAARDTCTIMEYAALLGEYRIVGALLLGGIDPTVSGELSGEPWSRQPAVSKDLVVRILQRFFDCFPTSLKAYIIKRVVEMRLCGWIHNFEGLCFGDPCFHNFSEEKLWIHLLNRIDEPDVKDVVRCPTCGASSQSTHINNAQSIDESWSPSERGKLALTKYLSLPATSNELKAKSNGKGRKKLAVASSWRDALAHSLGNSQDVRTDKFFVSVERGSLHFVRGCLESGVDVNLVNEYGQTALYLAAWKGHLAVVELLLHFGADPSIVSNGGSTALSVASANGHVDIASAISSSSCIDATVRDESALQFDVDWPVAKVDVLIHRTVNHPGAGSYIIDDCLAECHLEALVDLRRTLPLALSDKKKKKNVELCSDRFYYSDAHGWIRRLLETTIERNVSNAIVLPHMRFLDYDRAGSSLAPHVDLCRVDTDSGQRSTHTFILYLYSCSVGGETVLLESLTSTVPLATVTPTRGRLLLFPHNCPHKGAEVVDVPKLLLRGEVILESKSRG
jgi:Ankyrin repeats (3 copies)/2OG-Fe(II) oxygenase superfamily